MALCGFLSTHHGAATFLPWWFRLLSRTLYTHCPHCSSHFSEHRRSWQHFSPSVYTRPLRSPPQLTATVTIAQKPFLTPPYLSPLYPIEMLLSYFCRTQLGTTLSVILKLLISLSFSAAKLETHWGFIFLVFTLLPELMPRVRACVRVCAKWLNSEKNAWYLVCFIDQFFFDPW